MTDSAPKQPNDSVLAPGERPTLKTLAKLTGLAVATVSRALHDAPDIGSDTKKRVQEMAEKIGYRPNRAGVRLRTGKTNVISLILATNHDMTNHHTGLLISSIAAGLRNSPYHLIVTPHFPSEDPMIPVRYVVETQSADAVILNQTEPDDPRIAYLLEKQFPFATHGRSGWCEHHAYYDFDNCRLGEIAIEKLAARGRKSVLVVAPPLFQNYGQDLLQGTTRQARISGIRATTLVGATNDSPDHDLETAFCQHMQNNPDVDAVVCVSTATAMCVVAAAEDMNLEIGKDIDVFSKEGKPFLTKFRKTILTVNEDVTTAGNFLARAIMERIADPSKPPMQGLETPTL